MKHDNLHAVLDEDVARVLAELGQLHAVETGDILCHECGIPITLKNIQIIMALPSGEYHFVCDRTECVRSYMRKQEGG
jgi:D-ribose pyranose/furanose isomerase RbsD